MKAITLHQPWASLISIGVKTIETRPYAPKHRGLLAIHASKKPTQVDDLYYRSVLQAAELDYRRLPLGAVLATCNLVSCEIISSSNTPCYPEYAFGYFKPGWYAWQFEDIRAFSNPISACGHHGVWTWDPQP